jgi:hypothetical protein
LEMGPLDLELDVDAPGFVFAKGVDHARAVRRGRHRKRP